MSLIFMLLPFTPLLPTLMWTPLQFLVRAFHFQYVLAYVGLAHAHVGRDPDQVDYIVAVWGNYYVVVMLLLLTRRNQLA
jgi:hypothetical protein